MPEYVVSCDVAGLYADAPTVDALARLQLAARRQGWQLRFRNAPAQLSELVAFMGLSEVLRTSSNRPAGPAARTAGTAERYRGRT